MNHFPLFMIIPHNVYHQGNHSIYEYINYAMNSCSLSPTNRTYDWYSIGGQWNLYFAKSLSMCEYVNLQLELVSTLQYNIISVAEFIKDKCFNTLVLDKDLKLHNFDNPKLSINYEFLHSINNDYIVIIDCHI